MNIHHIVMVFELDYHRVRGWDCDRYPFADFRDIKASGIYVVLYNVMSGDRDEKLSPIRIVFAGGTAG